MVLKGRLRRISHDKPCAQLVELRRRMGASTEIPGNRCDYFYIRNVGVVQIAVGGRSRAYFQLQVCTLRYCPPKLYRSDAPNSWAVDMRSMILSSIDVSEAYLESQIQRGPLWAG